MKGLKNFGNTCYLNASLQMLINNKDLCNLINEYSIKSEILNKINDFILKYYSSDIDILIPNEIKSIVETKMQQFRGFGQQDSIEFTVCLLDIIEDEIKKFSINKVQIILGIETNTRTKCKLRTCLNISNKKETNNFLLLDINENSSTLDDIYRNYKSGEMLEDDNMYYCDKCKQKRNASKRYSVEKWAPNNLIWLKRFKQTKNGIIKMNQSLDIPLVWRYNMKLKGAIIHYGNLNGGHYVYVHNYNDMWYLFDDMNVSEISDEIELKKLLAHAYCLNYEKTL